MGGGVKDNEYYPHFDLLRFLLAVVVLIRHDGRLQHLIPLHWSGNLAVQVFFALSGWLIGGVLLDARPADVGRFYFNRVLRIWAPYYVALLLLIGASMARGPITAAMAEFLAYKATFTYNIFGTPQLATRVAEMPLGGTGNHFWSVNAEEQFYLLAPLLLVLAPGRFGRSRIVWVLVAALAFWTEILPSIVFGVVAAMFLRQNSARVGRRAIVVLAGLVIAASGFAFVEGASYMGVAPFFSVALVVLLAQPGEPNRVAKYLGAISYPLYLNHWIGIFLTNAIAKKVGMSDGALRNAACIVLSVAIAAVLYHLVDKQVLSRRHAWWSRQRGTLCMAASYLLIAIGLVFGLVFAA